VGGAGAASVVEESIDVIASVTIIGTLTLVLGAYVVASLAAGRALVTERVEREAGLPLVGKTPMHAVYRALFPVGRLVARLGISANAVSVSALFFAALSAVAFAFGHFGLAALIAAVSSLADGLDGLVARLTNTKSRFGQVLDTTIDRYVDAMFLGGIAMYVRTDPFLLFLTMAAIVGSFMVSYASSVERELSSVASAGMMRRAHRLAYLLVASVIAPFVGHAMSDKHAELVPVFLAIGAIAIGGNVSAVRRLFNAARTAAARETVPSSPDVEAAANAVPAPVPSSRHR
jgi:CDP-diacylglycerol---glycerol-3-phosphate 3-phosphatidyltransferase